MTIIPPTSGATVHSSMAASIAAMQNDINGIRVEIATMLHDELQITFKRLQDAVAERDELHKTRSEVLAKTHAIPSKLKEVSQKAHTLSCRIKTIEDKISTLIHFPVTKSFIREDLNKLYTFQKKLMDHVHEYTYPPGRLIPHQEVKITLSKAEFRIGTSNTPVDTMYPKEINPADYEV
jgi:hypothetical protein